MPIPTARLSARPSTRPITVRDTVASLAARLGRAGLGLVASACIVSLACGPLPTAKSASRRSAEDYIVKHPFALEREIAVGSGDHLRALARLGGCKDTALVGQTLKGERSEIFPAPDADTAADRILSVLARRTELDCAELTPSRGSPGARADAEAATKAADRANMVERYGN